MPVRPLRRAALLLAALPTLAAAQAPPASPDSVLALALRRTVARPAHPWLAEPVLAPRLRAALQAAYEAAGWRPLWLAGGQPTPAAIALLDQLARVRERGLDSARFDAGRLAPRVAPLAVRDLPADSLALLDVALSAAAGRLASALYLGQVNPRDAHPTLTAPPRALGVAAVLDSLRRAPQPARVLDALEPPFQQYALLKDALRRYRLLAADTALGPLPAMPRRLRPGAAWPGVPALRQRLRALGDLPDSLAASGPGDTLYDAPLVAAVQAFQRRQGFADDGVIGDSTRSRLTQPLAARVRQIELALERWRWLPHELGAPPIVVNLPAFTLKAYRTTDGQLPHAMEMNVVIGRAARTDTPPFSAMMRFLVFRPYWEVPTSIALEEIRPEASEKYFARHGYELVNAKGPVPLTPENLAALGETVRVRQRPGAGNSLGNVKFMLPNPHAIYLHDTPSRALFERARRDFSHGCIRVQDPVGLARHVLRDQPDWTEERITRAMAAETPTTVNLTAPVPVILLYATAEALPDGRVFFYGDVYGHDRALDRFLRTGRKPEPKPKPVQRPATPPAAVPASPVPSPATPG